MLSDFFLRHAKFCCGPEVSFAPPLLFLFVSVIFIPMILLSWFSGKTALHDCCTFELVKSGYLTSGRLTISVMVKFNFCWWAKGLPKVDSTVWDVVGDVHLRIYKPKYFISMCMYNIIYKYMVVFSMST